MKKFTINRFKLLAVCLVMLITGSAGRVLSQDHKAELTAFGGYLLGGSIKFYEGKFKIEDNACYGGNLAIRVSNGDFIELSYTGMTTTAVAFILVPAAAECTFPLPPRSSKAISPAG